MKTKVLNKFYPLQVWLTSLLISPILLLLLLPGAINEGSGLWIFFVFFFFVFSFFCSLPTFIIYSIAFMIIPWKKISTIAGKLILSTIAIFGMYVTFYFMGFKVDFAENSNGDIIFPLGYTIGILLSSLYFMPQKKEAPVDSLSPIFELDNNCNDTV